MYAEADLLIFQNRLEEALIKLDSITNTFPEHSLLDDVLYSKAQIYKKKLQPEMAIKLYEEIVEKYSEEIRCDNALYDMAQIYETHFKDLKKAQELYLKIFTEFDSSTFAIDARKKYRILRGDNL